MNARIPSRVEVFELVIRSMLGVALVAGIGWALTHGATPGAHIGGILR